MNTITQDVHETTLQNQAGEAAMPIRLTDINGQAFDSSSLLGRRYMITFFRFASCPFCNLRIHSLVQHFDELGEGFTVVAVFDSTLDNLQRFTAKHHAPFPILADETGYYFRKYAIKRSMFGMAKGMILRLPSLMYSVIRHGNLPRRFKGKLDIMPASFLVDENGIICEIYHGRDEGDHIPFDRVKRFSEQTDLQYTDDNDN